MGFKDFYKVFFLGLINTTCLIREKENLLKIFAYKEKKVL